MVGVKLLLLGPDPCINEAAISRPDTQPSPLCAAPYWPHTLPPIVSRPQMKGSLISQLTQFLMPALTDQSGASSLERRLPPEHESAGLRLVASAFKLLLAQHRTPEHPL